MRKVYVDFDDATRFDLVQIFLEDVPSLTPDFVGFPVYWWEEGGGLHVWPQPYPTINIMVEDQ